MAAASRRKSSTKPGVGKRQGAGASSVGGTAGRKQAAAPAQPAMAQTPKAIANPMMRVTLPARRAEPAVNKRSARDATVEPNSVQGWRRNLPRWHGQVKTRRDVGVADLGFAGGLVQGWANLRRGVHGNLMPWRDRFWSWMGRAQSTPVLPENGEISRESMASLQAAVMQELAHLQEQRHEPRALRAGEREDATGVGAAGLVRTKPFQGMPVAGGMGMPAPLLRRSSGEAKARRWPWMLAVVALIVGLVLVVRQMQRIDGPVEALESVRHSMQTADVAGFERHVDVAAVAESAAEQLQGRVQPDLTAALQTEILTGVSSGQARAVSGVLQQLLGSAEAADVRLGRVQLMPPVPGQPAPDETAVAEVMLERRGGAAVPLQVQLRQADGVWQVVALPSLTLTLNQLAAVEPAGGKLVNEPVQPLAGPAPKTVAASADMLRAMEVKVLEKAVTDDGQLLVRSRISNDGKQALRNVRVQLVFADAAGRPMKVAVVGLPGVTAAGAVREKSWLIPLDAQRRLDRYVRDLPLAALTVRAEVLAGQR